MKKITFSISILTGISLMIFTVTYAAQILNIGQGGTATSTIQANNVFFGSSGGVFMTQNGNLSFATTSNTLTTQNLTVNGTCTGCGSGSGAAADWLKQTNYGVLNLTASTTIPYWAKDAIYASSTLTVQGLANFAGAISSASSTFFSLNSFLSTTTEATSTFLSVSKNAKFDTIQVQSTTATSTFGTGGLTVGTNQFVVQQTSGNVGIGTTGPGTILSVSGQGVMGLFNNRNLATFVEAGGGYTDGHIEIGGSAGLGYFGTDANGDVLVGANTSHNVRLFASGAEKVRIDTNGNVGIGTTTPSNLLDIYSSTAAIQSFSGGATKGEWSLGYDVTNNRFAIASSTSITSNVRMVIDNSGNVGIGTASPDARLVVGSGPTSSNDIGFGAGAYANVGNRASTAYLVLGDNVKPAADPTDGMVNVNTHVSYAGSAIVVKGDSGIEFHTKSGPATAGAAYASVRAAIDSNGNVGIGTTSPVSKLSVVGESAFAGGASVGIGYAGTAAPTGGMIIQGNVGIGTTTPAAKLGVVGGAYFDGGTIIAASVNATSTLQIPNNGTTTLTVAGQIAVNTTQASSSLRYYDGTATRGISDLIAKTFTIASTTLLSGTTTIPLGTSLRGETWVSGVCYTDQGTAGVSFGTPNNLMLPYIAVTTSTTTTTFTSLNTFGLYGKRQMQIGTLVSSPNYITCSVYIRENAD